MKPTNENTTKRKPFLRHSRRLSFLVFVRFPNFRLNEKSPSVRRQDVSLYRRYLSHLKVLSDFSVVKSAVNFTVIVSSRPYVGLNKGEFIFQGTEKLSTEKLFI